MIKKQEITRRLYVDKEIIIATLNSGRIICEAKDVFRSWLAPNFSDSEVNMPSKKTPEIKVQVRELVKKANFAGIFKELNSDLSKLCLTQDQIIEFCVNSKKYLREEGKGNFFLFRANGRYQVATVAILNDGLTIERNYLEYPYKWDPEYAYRIIIPLAA
jgi:hypothetical protein